MATILENQRESSGNPTTTGGGLVSQAKQAKDTEYSQYKYFLDDDLIYTDKKGKNLAINKELIKNIIIERDYEYGNMPFVMIRGAVQDTTLLRLALGLPDGNMHIKVSKATPGFDNKDTDAYTSSEGASKQYINKKLYLDDTFQVLMEDQSLRLYEKFANRETVSSGREDQITSDDQRDNEEVMTIGLIKKEHLSRTKTIINSIIGAGTKTVDVLAFFFSEAGFTNVLLSNPTNGANKKDLIIPPMNFLDAIEYYNNLRGIYNTRYRFFQDFKRTYMLDTTGKCTAFEKKEPKKVIINVNSYGQKSSLTYGMTTMNKTSNTGASTADGEELVLSLPQTNVNIKTDAAFAKEKAFSSIYSINMRDSGSVKSKVNGLSGYENMIVRRNIYDNKYILESDSSRVGESNIVITTTLVDIDIDAFTPNKEYVFHFGSPNYSDLEGTYRLIKVTTILERASEEFTMYAMAEFRKVPV